MSVVESADGALAACEDAFAASAVLFAAVTTELAAPETAALTYSQLDESFRCDQWS
ncbi:hypothetical protein ABZ070_29980 [Streptomyces sp. NPDC006283]|uniref:hypothetical protein n=1 Tax=Streptomyces sp. NPDC006283 TaxID=3156741 RepID=UPI0033A3C043